MLELFNLLTNSVNGNQNAVSSLKLMKFIHQTMRVPVLAILLVLTITLLLLLPT